MGQCTPMREKDGRNNRFDQFTPDTLSRKQERKWVGKEGEMTACILGEIWKHTKHPAYVHPTQATKGYLALMTVNFRPNETCPTPDLAGMRIGPCCPSAPKGKNNARKSYKGGRANLE